MTLRVLTILENNKIFISGEKIAKELNISRSGVWKHIEKLKKMGYNIKSVTNKGYYLEGTNSEYNELEIKKYLRNIKFINEIYYFDEIDSTNDFLKELYLKKGNTKNSVLAVTNYQKKGKGRLGRSWIAPKDKDLFFSIMLMPNMEILEISKLTLMMALCICEAIKSFDNEIKVDIKWPNDIIINKKKIGGILCEISAEIDKISYAILGVGINVNNDNIEKDLINASSIFLQTNKHIDRRIILANIFENFEDMYLDYTNRRDFTEILKVYKQNCISLDKEVIVNYKNRKITGIVKDILENGSLLLKTKDGDINVTSNEVSIRMLDGSYI